MHEKCLIVELTVVPSSKKQKIILDKSGKLKCYLKSDPIRGMANQELIKLIANALGLAQNTIEIVTGSTSRKKRIKINRELTYNEFLQKLGIDYQTQLKI